MKEEKIFHLLTLLRDPLLPEEERDRIYRFFADRDPELWVPAVIKYMELLGIRVDPVLGGWWLDLPDGPVYVRRGEELRFLDFIR